MAEKPVPAVRRHAAVVLAGIVGFIVLLIVLRGIAGVVADAQRVSVLGAWAGSLGSFETILEAYPDRDANESALRVEELSAALGIDVTPRSADDRVRPTDSAKKNYDAASFAIGDYARRQLERSGPASDPPLAQVEAYLADHEAPLAELRSLLIEQEPPLWARRLERPYATPLPNLLGHVKLQKLLVADAMFRADRGDPQGALATLEASWQLNEPLREGPILTTQLIALTVARMQAGALRHIEPVPRLWGDRLYEHDFRASILSALQFEGWAWMHAVDPTAPGAATTSVPPLVVALTGPFLSYSAADLSEDWRRRLVEFSELDSFCDRDLERSGVSLNVTPAAWNLLATKTWISDLDEIPRRLARYELDREMTAKLLELRWARDGNAGRWPESLPGIEQSPTCPEDHWVYEATPGGEIALAFSRPVEWEGLRGARLPLRYVANP